MNYLKNPNTITCTYLIFIFIFIFSQAELSLAQNQNKPPSEPVPGQLWQESKTGIDFVWVPKGCFYMGSTTQETGHNPDESPVHKVCLDGFWMGRTEVSRNQFNEFVAATQYRTQAEKSGWAWVYENQEWIRQEGYTWGTPGIKQELDHPVIFISWQDARAMADWLSNQTLLKIRLPDERQWEYACRAGTNSSRYWGDALKPACNYENVSDLTARKNWPSWQVHPCEDGFATTSPVGNFKPNNFGLYDMLGNIQEWSRSPYDKNLYVKTRTRSENVKPETKNRQYVIRGGSWLNPPPDTRCARRFQGRYDFRSYQLGFRLVIEPD